MLTRREQLGTEDFQLASTPSTGRGKGRGKGKKKGEQKEEQEEKKESEKEVAEKGPASSVQPKSKARAKKPKTGEKDPSPKKQASSPEPKKKTTKPPAKRPASASAVKSPKKKANNAEKKKEDKEDKEDIPASQPRKKQDEETKGVATWGGRWVDKGNDFSRLKMKVIKGVFEECLQHKLRSQSSFQSPFFKICNQAFVEQDLNENTPESMLVTCAKNQVAKFLEEDRVRSWFLLSWFSFLFLKKNGILEN